MLTAQQRVVLLQSGAAPWYRTSGAPAPVAAYQPKGAASLAASYINLANPGTNNAAPGTAPTFAASTGWTFDGASQHLLTSIVPATGATLIVRFSNASGTGYLAGVTTTPGCALSAGRGTSGTAVRYYSGVGTNFKDVAPALVAGVLAVAGDKGYRNGVADVTLDGATGNAGGAITIGATTGPTLYAAITIQAVAIYNQTLTAQQVAAVSAAMAAL